MLDSCINLLLGFSSSSGFLLLLYRRLSTYVLVLISFGSSIVGYEVYQFDLISTAFKFEIIAC